jgi:S1-C subfamily serine protease
VTVEVVRAQRHHAVSLELARLPGVGTSFERGPPPAPKPALGPAGFRLGGTLVGGPSGQGLRVVEVDPTSPAFISGVRVGDVVLAVDDHPVQRPEDLVGFLDEAKVGRLFVRRGLRPMFIGVARRP